MNTTTLVTSPDIVGNIGSCHAVTTTANETMWRVMEIITNSCTGEIINTFSHTSGGAVSVAVLIGIFAVFVVGMIVSFRNI